MYLIRLFVETTKCHCKNGRSGRWAAAAAGWRVGENVRRATIPAETATQRRFLSALSPRSLGRVIG